jgi:hypothetical protein
MLLYFTYTSTPRQIKLFIFHRTEYVVCNQANLKCKVSASLQWFVEFVEYILGRSSPLWTLHFLLSQRILVFFLDRDTK